MPHLQFSQCHLGNSDRILKKHVETFAKTAGALLACFLITNSSHCKSNWFWSHGYFKRAVKIIRGSINFAFKNILGTFTPVNKTKALMCSAK